MEKTKKIVAIAMLISALNASQSNAYFSSDTGLDMSWDDFRSTSAASQTTKKYYTDGDKIKYECTFDNNKNGTCKKFYKNGHVSKEELSANNGRNTSYKNFFENGELASEGHFTNSQKSGLFREYYKRADSSSYRQVSSESSYKDGYQYGLSKEYSPNGTLTWSQNYNK